LPRGYVVEVQGLLRLELRPPSGT